MREKNQTEIKIKQVSGELLKALVNYCYTGKIEINSENILDLLASASMLRFERIEEKCKNFLEKQLVANPKTSLQIFLIADTYSFTDLVDKSVRILCKNFSFNSKLPYFNEISFEYFKRIIDSDEYFDVTEEEIFEAAMNWVDFNRNDRQKFIPNILKLIRLTQINPTVECRFNNKTLKILHFLYFINLVFYLFLFFSI